MAVKVYFTDFWKGFDKNNNYFLDLLKESVDDDIVIDKNPDILIYSCFGFDFLKYDCLKVFFAGENIVPDFNLCDYALGVHDIQFGKRYYRFPFYLLYTDACEKAVVRGNLDDNSLINRDFCSYVISNSLGDHKRKEIIKALSEYKTLCSGGKWNNNLGYCVPNKIDFSKKYKFCLALENSSVEGYTTEKIVEAFASGCIPIYWGNPAISSEFNEDAFINCANYDNWQDLIDDIKRIDESPELYLKMMHEPIIKGNAKLEMEKRKSELLAFLKAIVDNKNQIIRNNVYVGKRYQQRMKRFYWAFVVYRFFERLFGFIFNRLNIRVN